MPPDQVASPARRVYFSLQSAYIGTEPERFRGLESARRFIADLQNATTSDLVRSLLGQAMAAAEDDDCYKALKIVRGIIRHEDRMLGNMQTAHQKNMEH